MSKYEKGNWPAQDTKNIIASVRRVFEKRDIGQLSEKAYHHITLHMGFIAHYSRGGFMNVYSDLADFATNLLTSEYSQDLQHNEKNVDQYVRDNCFIREYGQAYCQSVTDSNRGIVKLARKHLPTMKAIRAQSIENAERQELARLQAKYC